MPEERKCKGSVILDMVKIVRAVKDQPWDRYLKPEDWTIINNMVIPTDWYPVEFYQRIGLAVYELAAGGSAEAVKQFGRLAMKELFHGPYRPFLDRRDPFLAVQKFMDLRRPLFNFSKMEMEPTGEQSLRVRISELGEFETGLDVFHLLAGVHFQQIAEFNVGHPVNLAMSLIGAKADPVLVIDLDWA
jgi:hypothetical protein